ncbi:ATP-dependent DEAD/H DNA helicase recQ family- like protein [Novymonas esmeraldas]|uniref:DNA 3'-5' helicase n=1 Tax=Novymonas esmeraldas TaxID=1808958 RepID=A0AAW0F611_9TRYP
MDERGDASVAQSVVTYVSSSHSCEAAPLLPERRGAEKRRRSASPDTPPTTAVAPLDAGVAATDVEEMVEGVEEPIPFLTTLSMNQTGFLQGRRQAPLLEGSDCRRLPHTGVRGGAAARHATSPPPTSGEVHVTRSLPAPSACLTSTPPPSPLFDTDNVASNDDVTYLEQMLACIMDVAATYRGAAGSVEPSTASSHAETLPACAYLLRAYFHLESGTFKPHQQAVCFSVLAGVSTLAVCPTGWGKSLCYQFPMLVHRLVFECRYARWRAEAEAAAAAATTTTITGAKGEAADAADGRCGAVAQARPTSSLPPHLFSRFCLVVSPLLALMEDQAEKVNSVAHLHACVLSSKVGAERESRLLVELESPLCPLDVLFVSPEKLITSVPLRRLLRSQAHRLAMVCVDEVHCVSGWAYDFRPTFMYVSRVLHTPVLADGLPRSHDGPNAASQEAALAAVPYLCLTATATKAVVRDVQASFGVARTVVCGDQRRENLQLEATDLVERHAAFHRLPSTAGDGGGADATEPSARVTQDALLEAVQQLPKPMIVYVQSRVDADALSGLLSAKCGRSRPRSSCSATTSAGPPGLFHPAQYSSPPAVERWDGDMETLEGDEGEEKEEEVQELEEVGSAGAPSREGLVIRCYHAALTRTVRSATQRQFVQGKIDVLVATIAFGMGVDKSNIRTVLHASAPSSLEGYVQEIGRAGRDGAPSVCRLLFNPFDFYTLRCRLWGALMSPSEMHAVVHAIVSGPTTRVGQRLMLVSVAAISTELGLSEEAIATVLFLLLTRTTTTTAADSALASSRTPPTPSSPFKSVLGSYPLCYKILRVADGLDAGTDAAPQSSSSSLPAVVTGGGADTGSRGRVHMSKRRRASASSAMNGNGGVGLLLRQLGATDAVLELCRVTPNAVNQIDMANQLAMPLADFQQRMQDLISSGAVTIAKFGTPSALLLEVSDSFAEASSPAAQQALTSRLLDLHRGRLDAQVAGLRRMFSVLRHPTHDAIAAELAREPDVRDGAVAAGGAAAWTPPGRGMSKMKAVSVANAFVEENRLRLHSTYEAVRALLGIRPRSFIQHGKYAGQLPLAQSWYVNSPYFGCLRTFDLPWVLQVMAAHNLDAPSTEARITGS